MSETMMIALITFSGSLLGAIIGAVSTIIAAKIQKFGETPKSNAWMNGLVGAILGGIVVFSGLWLSGMLSNSATIDVITIQDMQFSTESYTVGSDIDQVSSHLLIHSDKLGISYQLKYSVPQTNDVYAGFFFRMDNSENLENFNYVEITASFEDDNVSFDLFIKDITMPWGVPVIRVGELVNYSSDVKMVKKGNDYTITIPLSAFAPLDLKAIKEIGFSVGSFSSGTSSFTIKNLRFIKE